MPSSPLDKIEIDIVHDHPIKGTPKNQVNKKLTKKQAEYKLRQLRYQWHQANCACHVCGKLRRVLNDR